ncbi:uncharacterized protein [Apostichopus japonicus]|uniref:uncharacterized protein isoform X2 n=1 Tax=Stichopus japonicus TaxID=307972 RepID=UPI003AB13627
MRQTKMNIYIYWLVIGVLLTLSLRAKSEPTVHCDSRLYLNLHRPGIINCSVSEPVYGFYWYFDDYSQSVVTLLDDRQAGPRSNDLTIAQNGSLVFRNVSLSDEGRYRVDAILDAGGDVSTSIDVLVVVPTTQMFPAIDGCQGDDCRLFWYGELKLTCTMIGRPAVTLTWYNDTAEAAVMDATEQSYKDQSSDMFVSSSTINVKIDIEKTQTLTCTPSGLSVSERTKNASVLLMGPTNLANVYRTKYIDINEDTSYNEVLQSSCDSETMFIQTAEPSGKTITMTDKYDDPGQLILTSICLVNHTYTRSSMMLHRYKTPDDNSVSFIKNCESKHHCIIAADNGNVDLTCVVNNTHPAADISWTVLNRNISIFNMSASSSCILDRCNSSVTIQVTISDDQEDIEYPECLQCVVILSGYKFRHESYATLKMNGNHTANPPPSSSSTPSPSPTLSSSPSPSPSPLPSPSPTDCVSCWAICALLSIVIIATIPVHAAIYFCRTRKNGNNYNAAPQGEEIGLQVNDG